uniref:Cornichon family AMPA receptor auxiliary protein 4 n=1 Tax=Eptatretus burgeri TaxID=7764 RepID=A0A8C4WZX0_EPTBU
TACCSRLNKWVLPELVAHTGVTVLMLITMHWLVFLLNVPLAAWNICKYFSIPSGNVGLYDPTEIHNRGKLKFCMKEAMAKLGYHLLLFFIYLYSMIFAMVSD